MSDIKHIRKQVEDLVKPYGLKEGTDRMRDEIWRHVQNNSYSEDLSRSISKLISQDNTHASVLQTCFSIIEVHILKPIANLFNSAYVHGVHTRQFPLSEHKESFSSIERMLRNFENSKLSFGHRVNSVRIFMKDVKLFLPYLHLSEDCHMMLLNPEFKGSNLNELFIVRATQIIPTIQLRAEKYKIPPDTLGSFLYDNNPASNLVSQKCTLDGFFNMVCDCRNADGHEGSKSWWIKDDVFYSVIREYIEPAVLQLLMHPMILDLLKPEVVSIGKKLDGKYFLYQCNRLINPRSFTLSRETLNADKYYAIPKSVNGHEYQLLFPVQEFPKPTQSREYLDHVFQTFILWFYVKDGKLSEIEWEILKAVSHIFGVNDYIGKTNQFLEDFHNNTRHSKTKEQVREALVKHLPFCADKVLLSTCVNECMFLLENDTDLNSISQLKGSQVNESHNLEHDLLNGLENFHLENLVTYILGVAKEQHKYLIEMLENEFHSLSAEELSAKSGLPQAIINDRLNQLVGTTMIQSEPNINENHYKIVELKGRYKTQNVNLGDTFRNLLEEAKKNNHQGNTPEYVFGLFELCAGLLLQETNNDEFLKQVARLNKSKNLPTMSMFINEQTHITDQEPEKLVLFVLRNLKNVNCSIWRTKKHQLFFTEVETSTENIDEVERMSIKWEKRKFSVQRPYDELDCKEFLFLLGRIFSWKQNNMFPLLQIGGVTFNEIFHTKWKELQEQIVTLNMACEDLVGRRRSSKLHVRMKYVHDNVEYAILHRIPNMATLLAKVLYSLELTMHHAKFPDLSEEKLSVFQWKSTEDGTPLQLSQSIWNLSAIEDHSDWPIKSGRVRQYVNTVPFHHTGTDFINPYSYRLGETFDQDGNRILPPIEYWVEMNNSSGTHMDCLQLICSMCNVILEEIEWYPHVRIGERAFSFADDSEGSKGIKKSFENMLSYLLLDLKVTPDESLAKLMSLGGQETDMITGDDLIDSDMDEANAKPEAEIENTNVGKESKTLAWLALDRPSHYKRVFLSKDVLSGSMIDYILIGSYVVYPSQVELEVKRREYFIEEVLIKIFGLTKGEDFTMVYRTMKEISEEEHQTVVTTTHKTEDHFEHPDLHKGLVAEVHDVGNELQQ